MVSHLKKARNKWYPVETRTDADYTDNLVLLVNTPAQVKYPQHSLEQAAENIGLYVNANKTEYLCFKQKEAISTQSGKLLKIMN